MNIKKLGYSFAYIKDKDNYMMFFSDKEEHLDLLKNTVEELFKGKDKNNKKDVLRVIIDLGIPYRGVINNEYNITTIYYYLMEKLDKRMSVETIKDGKLYYKGSHKEIFTNIYGYRI